MRVKLGPTLFFHLPNLVSGVGLFTFCSCPYGPTTSAAEATATTTLLATTKKPSEDIRRPPLRPLSVAYFLSDKAIYSHPMVPRELTWPADPSHTADEPHDPLWSPQNL